MKLTRTSNDMSIYPYTWIVDNTPPPGYIELLNQNSTKVLHPDEMIAYARTDSNFEHIVYWNINGKFARQWFNELKDCMITESLDWGDFTGYFSLGSITHWGIHIVLAFEDAQNAMAAKLRLG